MSTFYNVTLAFEGEPDKNGKVKETKISYLVEDEDPTAAIAVAVDEFGGSETFRTVSCVETKIKDVITERERIANKELNKRSRVDFNIAAYGAAVVSGGKTQVVDTATGEVIGSQG